MGRIGVPELLIILLIILLLFGAAKLPQLAKSLGEGIKEFKKAVAGKGEDDKNEEKPKA
jgi:sec-independent protein translocase protein TatA